MAFCRRCIEFRTEEELAKADDTKILVDMGYTQELFRGVTGWFMNFAFTFTAVSFISSYSISFDKALKTGGPVVMVWGWIIGSTFTIITGLSLAEICSTYPSAGSVYHWAGMLSSPSWGPFFSYICGWFNFLGNAAGDAAFASGFASMVAASTESLGSELTIDSQVWISIGSLTLWCMINIMRIDQQGWLNNFAAVYQVTCSVVIVVVVLAGTQNYSSAEFVFFQYYDGTGFGAGIHPVYVVLIGLLTTLFAFSGYEAGGHIAEETQNSRKSAPRGIIACCLATAFFGIAYILGLLFSIPSGNIEGVLQKCDNGTCRGDFALANLFDASIGRVGGVGLTVLIAVNVFFAGVSSVTVTSRITFAMARDGAFPGSRILYNVNPYTKSPIRTVFLIWVFDATLLLLQLGSTEAFGAIVSLTTIGFQISYAIPIWLRVTHAKDTFLKAGFHLGRYSLLCGRISATWLTLTSLLFFFPFEYPVDGINMNYTSVVVTFVSIIAGLFWIFSARHWFEGPQKGILQDKYMEIK